MHTALQRSYDEKKHCLNLTQNVHRVGFPQTATDNFETKATELIIEFDLINDARPSSLHEGVDQTENIEPISLFKEIAMKDNSKEEVKTQIEEGAYSYS